MAIAQHLGVDLDQQSLHRLISLRNAFAHHATDAHATLVVGRTPNPDRREHRLHVISSSGRVSRTARDRASTQFDKAFEAAKRSLVGLLAKTTPTGEPDFQESSDV